MKKIINHKSIIYGITVVVIAIFSACSLPADLQKSENTTVPTSFNSKTDSISSALIQRKQFFSDANLISLVDAALKNNQELNITLQEINIAQNEVRRAKGRYLPFVGLNGGAGVEKVGRYTSQGANDANTDVLPNKPFPDPLPNFIAGVDISWEIDVWKKLRNSKKAAAKRYLSTIEGKNFMVTNLVSEIASAYYELVALDNQLELLKQNIEIQTNALEIVKLEKEATRVTELAVKRFEAEVFHSKSLQFDIQQRIFETENHINFLLGRYPQPIQRSGSTFMTFVPDSVQPGIPSQLLQNRPDIKRAELQLAAAKLDVKAAKANFYPTLFITAGAGFHAFNPAYFLKAPESLLYSVAGGLVTPLINRNAIKAEYYSAGARQVQAVYNYERSILNGYVEVVNQLSNIGNLQKNFALKSKQVENLTQSIEISTGLFKSARADYMEVLLTQRDALTAKFELVETKMQLMNARVYVYRALGGGWR
jgi:outer membrane protein, multidrug efflux system